MLKRVPAFFALKLFLAKDVAGWIEHSKASMMLQSIVEEEKVKVNNVYFEGRAGGNGTWFLTEDGLYEVLMQSRKPIEKAFKKIKLVCYYEDKKHIFYS